MAGYGITGALPMMAARKGLRALPAMCYNIRFGEEVTRGSRTDCRLRQLTGMTTAMSISFAERRKGS